MIRFSLAYLLAAAVWIAFVHRDAFGMLVMIYLFIAAPWGLYLAATRDRPREIVKTVHVPVVKEVPVATPYCAPTTTNKAEAARKKYDETLRMLEGAGLDSAELGAAKAKAKQQYLKDLDEAMR